MNSVALAVAFAVGITVAFVLIFAAGARRRRAKEAGHNQAGATPPRSGA